jgi:hypothetical protein
MNSFSDGIEKNYCYPAKRMCAYCHNLGHCELTGYCYYKPSPCGETTVDPETIYSTRQVPLNNEMPDELIINGVKYIKEVKE